MLQCWQEDPANRPSFSELRSSFTAMLQADSADGYIDLQVNNEAPYYQIEDIAQRKRSDSETSTSSDDSENGTDKPEKMRTKEKRKVANPYISTSEHVKQQQEQGGEEGYVEMKSAGSAKKRPIQLQIPISQLLPPSSPSHVECRHTPVDEDVPHQDSSLEHCVTNPYVQEPTEAIDVTIVDSGMRESSPFQ